ncbi:MAG: hypothetical protein ACRELY_20395 [Polyangiaceae bacterium]
MLRFVKTRGKMADFSIEPGGRKVAKRALASSLVVLFLAACGGAAEPAKSPAPASEMAPSAGGAPADMAQPESVQSAPSQPPPPSATGSSTASGTREIELRNARRDLQSASRDLDASLGDCSNACRALVSLERATAHLCELADSSSDHSACDDAKARVLRARAQIKASCGACSNGATLDANAPIR